MNFNFTPLSLAVLFVSVLMAFQGTEARTKKMHLKPRQPIKVASAPKMAIDKKAFNLLQGASLKADILDKSVGRILEVSSMSSWSRWRQNINMGNIQKDYSLDMRSHLSKMAELMKLRRQQGKLPQFQEFEFANLLRKSDYLLSLSISKEAVESAQKDKDFESSMHQTVAAYNQERIQLDHKVIHVGI